MMMSHVMMMLHVMMMSHVMMSHVMYNDAVTIQHFAGSGAFKIFHPMIFQKAMDMFYLFPDKGSLLC